MVTEANTFDCSLNEAAAAAIEELAHMVKEKTIAIRDRRMAAATILRLYATRRTRSDDRRTPDPNGSKPHPPQQPPQNAQPDLRSGPPTAPLESQLDPRTSTRSPHRDSRADGAAVPVQSGSYGQNLVARIWKLKAEAEAQRKQAVAGAARPPPAKT